MGGSVPILTCSKCQSKVTTAFPSPMDICIHDRLLLAFILILCHYPPKEPHFLAHTYRLRLVCHIFLSVNKKNICLSKALCGCHWDYKFKQLASHLVEFIHSLCTRWLCHIFPFVPQSPTSSFSSLSADELTSLSSSLRKWKQHKPSSVHTTSTSTTPCIWTPRTWLLSGYFGEGSMLWYNGSPSTCSLDPSTSYLHKYITVPSMIWLSG